MAQAIAPVTVQFTIQLQAQLQEFGTGQIDPVAPCLGDRLEREVFKEPAQLGAADVDTPRYAAGRIPCQSEGTVPSEERLIIRA